MDNSEIKKMVQNEFKKQFDSAVDRAIEKSLHSGRGKKEVTDIVRRSLVDFHKFIFNKRTTWGNEIKG